MDYYLCQVFLVLKMSWIAKLAKDGNYLKTMLLLFPDWC
jgi:hypothetical protein